jgi:transposase-like protein
VSTSTVAGSGVDGTRRTARNRPLAAWRKARAVELAIEGCTYDQIAAEVGYANRGTAYKVVQAALGARTVAGVDALRSVESARLDALQAALWPDAMAGDVSAVQAIVKIVMQRCRLLGLLGPGEAARPSEQPRSVVVGAGDAAEGGAADCGDVGKSAAGTGVCRLGGLLLAP